MHQTSSIGTSAPRVLRVYTYFYTKAHLGMARQHAARVQRCAHGASSLNALCACSVTYMPHQRRQANPVSKPSPPPCSKHNFVLIGCVRASKTLARDHVTRHHRHCARSSTFLIGNGQPTTVSRRRQKPSAHAAVTASAPAPASSATPRRTVIGRLRRTPGGW